jgi:hypothetical protein
MKNRLFLILLLVVLSVKLNAQQYSTSDANFTYQVDGTRVIVAPSIDIPDELIISYDWTLGDGTESNEPNPFSPHGYDYRLPGTYRISLSVRYLDNTGAISSSTTLGDVNVFATEPFVERVTVGYDSPPPSSTILDPRIDNIGTIFPDVYFNIDYRINNPSNERYKWSLYVDGVFDQDVISVEDYYSFSLKKGVGVYNLELLVEKYNDASIFAWSNPLTIDVGYNSGSGCTTCYKESVISPSVTSIKEGGADVEFNYYTTTWSSDPTSGPPDECHQIRTSPGGYNITQFWTAVNENGQEFPIGTTTKYLNAPFYDIPLSINLSAGEYLIKCKTEPNNGLANETEHCYLYTEAKTKLLVKPELSFENPQFPATPAPEVPYNLDFPFQGGQETVVIRGTETITTGPDYRSKGSIMVYGDWIHIDRFTHNELRISCSQSESEARFGRIIVTFPNTYEQKIIYVSQPRSYWEVENNDDLALAIQNVEDGSKIVLNEGTYNVPIKILGKNITLASKFLETGDPYYIDNTIIDANSKGSVVRLVGDGSFEGTTKIVGMHLTGGFSGKGGGVYCSNANLDLEHVLIHGSYGGYGGGIYASNANINTNHVTITGNNSQDNSEVTPFPSSLQKFGSLMYLRDESKVFIKNSIVGTKESDGFEGAIFYEDYNWKTSEPCKITVSNSRVEGSRPNPHNWEISNCYIIYSRNGLNKFKYTDDFRVHSWYEARFEGPEFGNYWLNERSVYQRKGDDKRDLGALFHTVPYIGSKVFNAEPESVDFENTIAGQTTTREVEITNILDYKLTGKIWLAPYEKNEYGINVPFDVDDFSVIPDKISLEAGETKKIYVTFHPQSFGEKRGRIDIKTKSSPETYEIPISGKGVTKPDLVGEMRANETEINSGRPIHPVFSYQIRNAGGKPSTACKVKYYLSSADFSLVAADFLGEQIIPPLQPNESYSPLNPLEIGLPFDCSGRKFIIAVLDSENELVEHNEDNNWVVKEINITQVSTALSIESIYVMDAPYISTTKTEFGTFVTPYGRPGDEIKLWYVVRNSRDELLHYNLKVYLSEDGVYDADDIEIYSKQDAVHPSSKYNGLSGGQYNFIIPEDCNNRKTLLFRAYEVAIPEDYYSIHTGSQQFEFIREPDYDIFFSMDYHTPFYPGENYDARISLAANRNTDWAPGVEIKFYLSSDPSYDSNDIELGATKTDDFTEGTGYYQVSSQLKIPHQTAPGTWYIVSVADPDNLFEEPDETNNTNYSPVEILRRPDLTLSPIEINQTNVMAGATVTASGTVSNIDYGDAPESKLKFYLSENEVLHPSNDIELGVVTVSELANGEIFNVTDFELPIPSETAGGNWYIIAKADGEISCLNNWCDIKESNENNNIVMGQISVWRQPDLYFGSMHLSKENATMSSFLEGSEIDLGYEVFHSNGNMNSIGGNNDLSHAGDYILRIYLSNNEILDTETDRRLSSIILGSSEGNTWQNGVLPITLPENLEGEQWYVFAVIDVNEQVDERDETNNTWMQEITITEKPDLEIQSFSVEPAIAIQGITNTLHFSSFVKNISPMNKINYASVSYYFSADNLLSPDDIFVYSVSSNLSDDLNNEATMPNYGDNWESSAWSQGIEHGQYYLIAEAKPIAGTIEDNLENNVLAIPFEIVQPTDLEIVNLSLDRTTIQEGSDFTVTCTVRNNNATTSVPTHLLFSFDPWKDFSNSSFSNVFENIEIGSLAQGETIDITHTYTVPEGKNAYYFHAICDIENLNLEANKMNNRANVPVNIQRVYPPLQVTVAITSPTSNGGNDGEARCNVTGGDGNYTYKWHKGGVEVGEGIWLNNVEAGEYFVEVKDLSGNSGTESFVVTEPHALASTAIVTQHVSTHNGNDGAVEIEVLSGNPPFQIHLSNGYSEIWPIGKTIGTFTGLPAGHLNIEITEDNSPVNNNHNYHSVYINNQIYVAYQVTSINQYGANNGAINVHSIHGALPPYNYLWTKNNEEISTDASISNLSPGTYILEVTDNTGNTKTEEIIITEPNELIVEYVVTDVSVTGQSDGAIDLTVISGNPPYIFQWQNGNTNEDVSNWPAGIHSVVITDAYHSITKNIRIGQPFTITATSHVNVTTHGESNGSLQCSVTGGFTPYQYTWMKNGEAYATGVTSLNNISAGIYELRVEDVQGNTVSETFTVTEPNPIEGTISLLNHPSTFGGTDGVIEINITNGNPPYTILSYGNVLETWTNGKTNGTITGLSNGGHYIEVRDSKSQTSGDAMVQMINMFNPINLEPNVTHVGHHEGNNGNISLLISCGRPVISCVWQKDGNAYIPKGSLERIHPTANYYRFIEPNLTAGIYTTTVTDDIGRTNSMDIKVAQPNELIVESHITNVSLAGGNNGRIDLEIRSGNPPYTFYWSKQGTSGYISHNEDVTGLSTGVYQLRVIDNANQYFDQTMNVQEPIKINFAIEEVKTPGGSQGKISANATSGVGPYTHEWTLNGTPFANNTQFLESLSAGEYTVTITDKTGSVGTETITLSDPEPLTISFDVTDVSDYNHSDGAIDLTVSGGLPPYTIDWSRSGFSGNFSHLEDVNNLEPGIYRVFVSDGYTTVYNTNIEVRNALNISATKINNNVVMANDGLVNLRCTGGRPPYRLDWYLSGTGIAVLENLADNELATFDNLQTGLYACVYTDSQGKAVSKSIYISDPITIELITENLSGPETNDASISAEISGGLPPYHIEWKKDNGFFSNDENLNNLSPGYYDITVTDAEGRSANGNRIVIGSYLPTVEISGGGNICSDGGQATINMDFTGRPPWSVQLNNGTNSFWIQNINSENYEYITSIPGLYHATSVSDNIYYGTYSGNAIVIANELPTATITGGGTLCANTEGVPVSIDFTGEAPWSVTYTNGTLTYLYENITESHYEFVTDLPGTYAITSVSDANCTGTGSGVAEVIALQVPTAHITGGKGICNNQGSALVGVQLGGTAPWNITYSDGTDFYTINGITEPLYEIVTNVPGIYSVTEVNDATGCPGYSVNSIEVSNHELPTANISGETACENQEANLSFNLTGVAPWTITYTDGINSSEIVAWASDFELPVSVEGTYQVTAIEDNFCTGIDLGSSAEIIFNPSPEVNLGADASICEGSTLTLDAGSGFQSYSWNGQPGGSQIDVSVAGTYTVELTDANGCTATDQIEVDVNPIPIVDLGPDITAPQDAFIYLEAEPGYQNYEWPGNNNCQILCVSMQNVSTSAEVWLNVTDENGCVGTDRIRLNLATPPQTTAPDEESNNNPVANYTLNKFDISKDEVVEEEKEELVYYQLFPNPTTGKLTVLISDPSKVKSIKVYDLSGNLIKSFNYILNDRIELDLTNYAKGAYLVKIEEVSTIKEFKIIRN